MQQYYSYITKFCIPQTLNYNHFRDIILNLGSGSRYILLEAIHSPVATSAVDVQYN